MFITQAPAVRSQVDWRLQDAMQNRRDKLINQSFKNLDKFKETLYKTDKQQFDTAKKINTSKALAQMLSSGSKDELANAYDTTSNWNLIDQSKLTDALYKRNNALTDLEMRDVKAQEDIDRANISRALNIEKANTDIEQMNNRNKFSEVELLNNNAKTRFNQAKTLYDINKDENETVVVQDPLTGKDIEVSKRDANAYKAANTNQQMIDLAWDGLSDKEKITINKALNSGDSKAIKQAESKLIKLGRKAYDKQIANQQRIDKTIEIMKNNPNTPSSALAQLLVLNDNVSGIDAVNLEGELRNNFNSWLKTDEGDAKYRKNLVNLYRQKQ